MAQTGGKVEGRSLENPDEPPLTVGQEVALFVIPMDASALGIVGVNAGVVGGGQGAYSVDSVGMLQPTRVCPPSGSVDEKLRGANAKSVASQAANSIGKPRTPPEPTGTTGTTAPAVAPKG